MKEITSKSGLAIALSRLKTFEKQKVREEQYPTEPEEAAGLLWAMKMKGELDGKDIADLGSGAGILGLGALLLGAKKAFFVDKDNDAMEIAIQNYNALKQEGYPIGDAEFIVKDINEFSKNADVVVENPPFGTKEEHADRAFLAKAFSTAPVVYSFHKTSTERFVEAFSRDNGFKVSEKARIGLPIKAAHSFHTKKAKVIEVTIFRLEKA